MRATPEAKRDLFEFSTAQILEEEVGNGIVGHEDIGQAIAVEIAERHAHALADSGRDAGRTRHIGERAVVVVVEELVGQAAINTRMAVEGLALGGAGGI